MKFIIFFSVAFLFLFTNSFSMDVALAGMTVKQEQEDGYKKFVALKDQKEVAWLRVAKDGTLKSEGDRKIINGLISQFTQGKK